MTTNTTSPETTPDSPFLAFCDAVEQAMNDIRTARLVAARECIDVSVAVGRARKVLQNYGVVTPDVNPDGIAWLPDAVRKLCEERDKLAACLKCVTKSRDWWRKNYRAMEADVAGAAESADRARRWCVVFCALFTFVSVWLFALAAERLFTSP